MKRFDAIVLGAGVAGAAAAYHLAARGSVLVLEQFEFLHTLGSSHGGSRIFRHAYDDERYVRLAMAADGGWSALEGGTGERLLLRTGGLDIGSAGGAELDAIAGALGAAGRPFERLTPAEVCVRFPAYRLGELQEALFQPDAGILPATRCLATMLRAAAASGAQLRAQERVLGLEAVPGGVELRTAQARYGAERLVVTAGAWLGRLCAELELPLRIEHQQVLYVRVDHAPPFAPYRMPIFIDWSSGIYGLPLFERPDAIKVSDHYGAPELPPEVAPEERDLGLDGERASDTVRQVRALLPGLGGRIVDGQRCLYTKTPDEHFIVDRHPEHEQIVIGGGFSGHGFKFAPVIGEALADLATHGASTHDLSLFSAKRFG